MGTLHKDSMCIYDNISRLLHRLVDCCPTCVALYIVPLEGHFKITGGLNISALNLK